MFIGFLLDTCSEVEMNIKKLLGKRIQEIRKKRKLTQEKVAELINIETVSLSNIENGRYYPTAENLEKILKVLNITPEELFKISHLQKKEILIDEIICLLQNNPDKLEEIYKVVKVIAE